MPTTRGARLILIVFIIVEMIGIASLVVGPSRFERSPGRVLASVEFRSLLLWRFVQPPDALEPSSDDAPFIRVVRLSRAGDYRAAETQFAPRLRARTWVSGRTTERIEPISELGPWLIAAAPHLRVSQERRELSGGTLIETVWATSDELRPRGIAAYDLVFRARSRDGKIDALAVFADPPFTEGSFTASPSDQSQRFGVLVADGLALGALVLPLGPGCVILARRRRFGLALLAVPPLAAALAVIVTVGSGRDNDLSHLLPDAVLYVAHARAAEGLELIGMAPRLEATQWIKAASHARSPGDVGRVSRGIQADRLRAGYAASLDANLCALSEHNSPAVQRAIADARVACPW